MKTILKLVFLSILSFGLAACSSDTISVGQGAGSSKFEELSTYSIAPVKGGNRFFSMLGSRAAYDAALVNSIKKELEAKNYVYTENAEAADFIIKPSFKEFVFNLPSKIADESNNQTSTGDTHTETYLNVQLLAVLKGETKLAWAAYPTDKLFRATIKTASISTCVRWSFEDFPVSKAEKKSDEGASKLPPSERAKTPQERQALWNFATQEQIDAAQKIYQKAKDENRRLTDEERREIYKIESEIKVPEGVSLSDVKPVAQNSKAPLLEEVK